MLQRKDRPYATVPRYALERDPEHYFRNTPSPPAAAVNQATARRSQLLAFCLISVVCATAIPSEAAPCYERTSLHFPTG